MLKERKQRRLSAIMVVDVVGFSKLMEADENSTLSLIQTLRNTLLSPRIAEHSGRVVKFLGDGVLAEFSSAVDAVECAASIQKRLTKEALVEGPLQNVQLRIGVNVGDVVVDGDDLLGDGVNVASRLEQLSDPGGVLISGTVFDQIQGKAKIKAKDRGNQKVKNISRPIRTYAIAIPKPKTVEKELRGTTRVFFALFNVFMIVLLALLLGYAAIFKERVVPVTPSPLINTPLVNAPPESSNNVFGEGFIAPLDNSERVTDVPANMRDDGVAGEAVAPIGKNKMTTSASMDVLLPVTEGVSLKRMLMDQGSSEEDAIAIQTALVVNFSFDFRAGQWLRTSIAADPNTSSKRIIRVSLYDANDLHVATVALADNGRYTAVERDYNEMNEYRLQFPEKETMAEALAHYNAVKARHPVLAPYPFYQVVLQHPQTRRTSFAVQVGRFASLSQAMSICNDIMKETNSGKRDECFPTPR